MYCTNCGNKLNNNDNFCNNCGEKRIELENINVNSNVVNKNNSSNGMKTASIILGSISIVGSLMFIFAPFCFILSIIGLILGICALKKGKNVPGILLNSIGFVLSIIMSVIIVMFFIFAFRTAEVNDYQYEEYYDSFYDGYNNNKF